LGEGLVPETEAIAIVDTWLATPFEGGRHARRVAQIAALELEENHSEDLRQPTATTDVQQQ
jgi:ribose 5-phosphate isomerase RpiB